MKSAWLVSLFAGGFILSCTAPADARVHKRSHNMHSTHYYRSAVHSHRDYTAFGWRDTAAPLGSFSNPRVVEEFWRRNQDRGDQ